MGSDGHVIVVGGRPGAARWARDRIRDLEARWSRFRPNSEISRLTAGAGTPQAVSPETALLVRRAVEAWHLSGGAFDPTVLGAVRRAGYVHSLDLGPIATRGASLLLTGCRDIVVDGDLVGLPRGTGFDPGGIGKGLAADLVVAGCWPAGLTAPASTSAATSG
jgi:thiamine biosynthesis lipoprotein